MLAAGLVLLGCSSEPKKVETATTACACGVATPHKEGATCVCADIVRERKGWCDHCGAGMASGQRTTCERCVKAGKLCDACAAEGKPCAACQAR